MAKLSTEARNAMSSRVFALPGKHFPLNDRIHQEKALQLVGRSLKAGNNSPAQAATVRRKARAKLHGK